MFLLCLISGSSAFAGAGITYYGRLLKSDEQPVIASSVIFKVQIRTPGSENCLLYEEQQVKDLSASKGVFALTINDGTATVVNTEPFGLDRAFQNRGMFSFSSGKCASGNTYAPNPSDGRKIVVEFNDGSFGGWEQIPPQSVNPVPMAIEAMTVGGYNASNLVRVVDGTGAPAVVSPLTSVQHNALLDLIAGTSSSYLTSLSSLNGARLADGTVTDLKLAAGISGSKISGSIPGNAAGFTGSLSGDVSGTQSSTTVTRIQGRAVDTAAPSNGQALVWSAGNNRWEPGTVSGGASDWSTLTGKPTTFASDWSTLSNIPPTFSPSAHSHPINEITSGSGAYFNYSPNGAACSAGEVLKWDTGGGGRWICGIDAGSAGTLVSLTTNAPIVKTGTTSDPILSISDASTAAKGVVQLAASSDTTAGLAVQANDSRLTDGRAPTGTAGGELTGNYPNPTVVASTTTSNNSLVRRDGAGGITGAAGNFSSLALTNGTSTLTLSTPVAFTTYATKLPATAGTNGQVMTSNGTDMIWANASSLTAGNVSGTVAIANGGTGAATAGAARTNLGITTTGDALATAASATAARSAINALSDTDSRLTPTPGAGNALNYIRVNSGGTAYEARTAGNVLSDIGAMAAVAAGTNGNVLTSNGTSWTSSALPNATTSAKGVMQVGTGLAVSSGTVSADFGTGAGKIAQGNDSRFPAGTCASGNASRWDGSAWQCETAGGTDNTKVAKTGDTMSGTLTLSAGSVITPTNGLVVGTNQLVAASGRVGIGTASPSERLTVLASGTTLMRVGDSSTGGSLTLGQDSVLGPIIQSHTDSSGNSLQNATASRIGINAQGFQIYTSPVTAVGTARTFTERLTMDNAGNVGIGTTAPSYKLDIRDGTAANVQARATTAGVTNSASINIDRADSANGYAGIGYLTNGSPIWTVNVPAGTNDIRFYDHNGTADERMRIQSVTGNVGIGTTSPSTKLHVVGSVRMVDGNQAAGKVMTSDANGVGSWQDAGGGSAVIVFASAYVPAYSTRYYPMNAGNTLIASSEGDVTYPLPRSGTLKNFYLRTATSQAAGGTLILTVRKNGAPTALAITVPASTASGTVLSNTSSTVTVSPGDYITIQGVNGSSQNSAIPNMVLEFAN